MPLLLSYYGDDFTGSTDVMEALASHGVKTVLFTRQPSPGEFRPFTDYQAVGLAGTSRSQPPQWMETNLRPAFAWLKGLGAEFCHYKVCSTFDSSPLTGSIGKAIDIGAEVFAQGIVPLVVGAPQLKRYTAFGNLFAAYQGRIYRIDRHPVMRRHPVTPMTEADLTLHLGQQTARPVTCITPGLAPDSAELGGGGIVLIDVLDHATQAAAGRLLLQSRARIGPFVAGSSGVEYALLAALREQGRIAGTEAFPPPGAVDRIAVVSGSCSPTTGRQIRFALDQGFAGLPLDPLALAQGQGVIEAAAKGVELLKSGRSVIAYTALGGATDRSAELADDATARHMIGTSLGRILKAMVEQGALSRAVIAGGDTSSHAMAELGILALTTRFPLEATPGSPLCATHGFRHGFEIAMKGGQVGGDGYFVQMRDGYQRRL